MSETAQQLAEIRHHLTEHDQRFDHFDAKLVGLDRKIGGLGVQIENVQSTVQLLAEQMSGFIRANSNVRVSTAWRRSNG